MNGEVLIISKLEIDEIRSKLDNIQNLLDKSRKSDDIEEIMTREEVCKLLRISEPTLYRYMKHHKLPSKKIGNQRRFIRSDVNKWISEQRING